MIFARSSENNNTVKGGVKTDLELESHNIMCLSYGLCSYYFLNILLVTVDHRILLYQNLSL